MPLTLPPSVDPGFVSFLQGREGLVVEKALGEIDPLTHALSHSFCFLSLSLFLSLLFLIFILIDGNHGQSCSPLSGSWEIGRSAPITERLCDLCQDPRLSEPAYLST